MGTRPAEHGSAPVKSRLPTAEEAASEERTNHRRFRGCCSRHRDHHRSDHRGRSCACRDGNRGREAGASARATTSAVPTPLATASTGAAAASASADAPAVTDAEVASSLQRLLRRAFFQGRRPRQSRPPKCGFEGGIVQVTFDPAKAGITRDQFDYINPFPNLASFVASPIAFNDEVGNRIRPSVESIAAVASDGAPLGPSPTTRSSPSTSSTAEATSVDRARGGCTTCSAHLHRRHSRALYVHAGDDDARRPVAGAGGGRARSTRRTRPNHKAPHVADCCEAVAQARVGLRAPCPSTPRWIAQTRQGDRRMACHPGEPDERRVHTEPGLQGRPSKASSRIANWHIGEVPTSWFESAVRAHSPRKPRGNLRVLMTSIGAAAGLVAAGLTASAVAESAPVWRSSAFERWPTTADVAVPWNRIPIPVERPSALGSAIRATSGIRE